MQGIIYVNISYAQIPHPNSWDCMQVVLLRNVVSHPKTSNPAGMVWTEAETFSSSPTQSFHFAWLQSVAGIMEEELRLECIVDANYAYL